MQLFSKIGLSFLLVVRHAEFSTYHSHMSSSYTSYKSYSALHFS